MRVSLCVLTVKRLFAYRYWLQCNFFCLRFCFFLKRFCIHMYRVPLTAMPLLWISFIHVFTKCASVYWQLHFWAAVQSCIDACVHQYFLCITNCSYQYLMLKFCAYMFERQFISVFTLICVIFRFITALSALQLYVLHMCVSDSYSVFFLKKFNIVFLFLLFKYFTSKSIFTIYEPFIIHFFTNGDNNN